MYVFLDESGGLSFDFTKGGTTRFFVVCLLVVPTANDHRWLLRSVERTIRHKLHKGRQPRRLTDELKGTEIDLATKQYFFRQAQAATFSISALILNKGTVNEALRREPERLYDAMAQTLITRCPLYQAQDRIFLMLDRRLHAPDIRAFNQSLLIKLQRFLPVRTPCELFHQPSEGNKGIQAVDLFCWGIFRKYERDDEHWYRVFRERIVLEEVYEPGREKNSL